VVEWLLCTGKALGSIPTTSRKEQQISQGKESILPPEIKEASKEGNET
jgi:hypothetical protein